ncbi:MAG: type II toxin-antitoxin system VapC family toxin [Thermoplasmata archaeon]
MTLLVDTNAFFLSETTLKHAVEQGKKLTTNPIVLYEVVKVCEEETQFTEDEERITLLHQVKTRLPELLERLDISTPPLEVSPSDLKQAYSTMAGKDVDIGDALIYIDMRKRGVTEILTQDRDFERLDVTIYAVGS